MPDPAVTASGERFARDMRRIRDEHGVSMDDIHDKTMISGHIIESFEQDGLFEHPTFNQVYLRSFIRSYANAAGIDPEDALDHLDRALAGDYANQLAVQYLGDEPTEPPAPTPDDPTPDDTEDPGAVPLPPDVDESERASPGTNDADQPDDDHEAASTVRADEEEPIQDENRRGILIGIGAVLVIIIAWVLVDAFQGGNTPTSAETSVAAADTADTTDQLMFISFDSLARLTAPRVDIGDTMYFTIIAQERLGPIRIQRDDDYRRPYYFNRGQAGVFPAQQEIVFSEDLEDIRLLVNGYEYPNLQSLTPPLVMSRDSVQTFLDTTTTDPLQLVVPADTFPVGGS